MIVLGDKQKTNSHFIINLDMSAGGFHTPVEVDVYAETSEEATNILEQHFKNLGFKTQFISRKEIKKMSHVIIVETNKDGKIELTKDELQKLLDESYQDGYKDGNKNSTTITYPYYSYSKDAMNDSITIPPNKVTL